MEELFAWHHWLANFYADFARYKLTSVARKYCEKIKSGHDTEHQMREFC